MLLLPFSCLNTKKACFGGFSFDNYSVDNDHRSFSSVLFMYDQFFNRYVIVSDYVKPISQCRCRRTCILNGEPLGEGEKGLGSKRGGKSVYSQPGI